MADPEALFAANHKRLFGYFCRVVGRPDAARDLTQEVFLRVTRTSIPAAPVATSRTMATSRAAHSYERIDR